jgi:catechol 2,3-dioxygenase-like lactoylglutathione lyase family enzyme
MIEGLNHITLSVHNLDISLPFYVDLLGCKPLARWKTGAYLTAGSLWLCLTLDKNTRQTPLQEYTHIAFTVSSDNFPIMKAKIKSFGVNIWKQNNSEGQSLYFLDPNGHKLEIHVSGLNDRITACKQAPYCDMIFFEEP